MPEKRIPYTKSIELSGLNIVKPEVIEVPLEELKIVKPIRTTVKIGELKLAKKEKSQSSKC